MDRELTSPSGATTPLERGAAPPAALRTEMYFFMRLAREWDLRFERLVRTGGVSKWYSAVGNEATTVAAASAIEAGDALVTLHRDCGAILRYYVDPARLCPELFQDKLERRAPDTDPRPILLKLASQMLGKATGFSGGHERSFHYSHFDLPAGICHTGMISHLGAMIPVAAGQALAFVEEDRDRVALSFIGEGGTSTGDFHEALNMAAVLKLPLILVIENNGYAFSTPASQQFACRSLADRALGYGMSGEVVDGNDPVAVYAAVREAVHRARAGEGPALVEARLGRMRGHSEGDDSHQQLPAAERERYAANDPVKRFRERLRRENGLDDLLERIDAFCADFVLEVVGAAVDAPDPRATGGGRPVYAEPAGDGTPPGAGGAGDRPAPAEEVPPAELSYLEAIALALREEMQRDERVFLLGQDIGAYGGAFKLTRGFVEEFGRSRVINTPIAESGTIGIAVGAALLDRRPVVEMQFADFITCGFNQMVNVAAKMYWRTGQAVPMVVRCPAGGGVGAGAFHSQNPEAWFLHTAGLKVVSPAWPEDARGLLKSAIRDPNPVVYLEHKYLYRRLRGSSQPGAEFGATAGGCIPFGKARVVRRGTDVTIIAYGWMVHRALEAAEVAALDGISTAVVDLRSLAPLDMDTILDSVKRTGKVIVVHEAPRTGGFGGEIAARIAEEAFEYLDGPLRRIAFPDEPVPFHRSLEESYLPGVGTIAAQLRELKQY